MPSTSLITFCIAAFVLMFVISGFLFGLVRGRRRSAIRLVFILVGGFAMFFAAGAITSSIMEIKVSGHTIVDHVATALEDVSFIGTGTINVAKTLAVALATPFVFGLLFWLWKIISWPIYAAVVAKYAKKDFDPNNRKQPDKPLRKKGPLWGGLIGALQGFILAFLFLIPIGGVMNMVSASADSLLEIPQIEQEIGKETLEKIVDYADVYKPVKYFFPGQNEMFKFLTTKKDSKTGLTVSATAEVSNLFDVAGEINRIGVLDVIIDGKNVIDNIYNIVKEDSPNATPADPNRKVAHDLFDNVLKPIFKSAVCRQFLLDVVTDTARDLPGVSPDYKAKVSNWTKERQDVSNIAANLALQAFGLMQEIKGTPDTAAVAARLKGDNELMGIGEILDNFFDLQIMAGIEKPMLRKFLDMANIDSQVGDLIDDNTFVLSDFFVNMFDEGMKFDKIASVLADLMVIGDIITGIDDVATIIGDGVTLEEILEIAGQISDILLDLEPATEDLLLSMLPEFVIDDEIINNLEDMLFDPSFDTWRDSVSIDLELAEKIWELIGKIKG